MSDDDTTDATAPVDSKSDDAETHPIKFFGDR